MRSRIGIRARRRAIGIGPGAFGSQICFLVAAPQLDLVAVAFGHEEAGVGAVHLDHRVVGGGGAVHEDVELGAELRQRQAEALGSWPRPVHHADRLVVERARRLVEHDLARGRDANEVGERSADVYSDAVTHQATLTTDGAQLGAH